MSSLKLYSTGCARNSRTVPLELGTPVITMDFPGIMDWQFSEVIKISDTLAMSIDFAVLNNEWAYYVIVEEKTSKGNWRFTFTMCGLKTYMMTGKNTIKGKWNRTPTWIDKDTVTPAVSGYKRGRDIDLPGLLPVGWVFVEIGIRLEGVVIASLGESQTVKEERNVIIGTFARKNTSITEDTLSVKEIVYNLSSYNYSVDGGITFDSQMDIEQIETISYSRLCPYDFEIVNGVPELTNATKEFYLRKSFDSSQYTMNIKEVINDTNIQKNMSEHDIVDFVRSNYYHKWSDGKADKCLFMNDNIGAYYYFEHVGTTGVPLFSPIYKATYYETDPRTINIPNPKKKAYVYGCNDVTFNTDKPERIYDLNPIIGEFTLGLTNTERKFGVATVFAPQVMGVIDRSQTTISYSYEVDNTGWYLNLYTPMNKIVIPSMKLPYVSDAWRAYQMREMEYDRAELNRSNQYANDKFWGDIAKGMANGALAGGFAGTHSPAFGLAMGGTQFIGTAIGASIDRRVETENNKRAYDNIVERMKTEVDSYYNSGYGYRMVDSTDFCINIAMPIDDMDNEVKMSGYSCTGNLTAVLTTGFIQGMPEPNDEIKGTIRNLIVNELQSGVWII